VKKATHATAAPGSGRLFDLRDTTRPQEGFAGAHSFGDPADSRLIVHPEADPVFVEQYRYLAAALHRAQLHEGICSVMVASAIAGEGKTVSATNLALILSRSFKKRVLLVDGDLRKPSIHELLRLENGSGLSDMLKRPGERPALQTLSHTLSVFTGGQPDPDPVALLVSDAAGRFLADMRDQFDWVVVDTPPVLLFPDAGLFAGMLDTCVMVVGAASTPSTTAATAVTTIGPSRIIGVVLNRAEPSEIAEGYGYGQYGYPDSGSARGPGSRLPISL
jgi:capsular exopolysaccharide synthesis family protein